MNNTHHYDVRLTWLSARKGVLSSPVLDESFEVATPPEFPGGIPGVWSPEHLFVAAISSCFMTTFLSIAEKSKLPFKRFNCAATGTLTMHEGRFMITEVTLTPHVVITSVADEQKTKMLLEKAEQHCLISNSVKSEIHLVPAIEIEAMANAS